MMKQLYQTDNKMKKKQVQETAAMRSRAAANPCSKAAGLRRAGFAAAMLTTAISLAACGPGKKAVEETDTEAAAAVAAQGQPSASEAAGETVSGSAAPAAAEAESPAALPQEAKASGAAEETEETETYDSAEAYAGTVAAEGVNEAASPYFGIMHARVTGVQDDSEDGSKLYTLQDLSDPENAWAISEADIGDMEAELTPGSSVALLFHGDIVSDSENMRFIAVVPEGTYSVKRAEGVTTQNVMSTFAIQAASGEELIFLKDNCEIEDGAMQNDAGDAVVVYYAQSADGVNYPLKIYRAS